MKQLTAMAWKEWNETRICLWIALGVFIGLPLVQGIEELHQFASFDMRASSWVTAFGGLLAIFIAIGGTCRDLRDRLADFWQSRPVAIVPWMLVKYFEGLAALMAGCLLPILVQWLVNPDAFSRQINLTWLPLPFMWAALYSVSFLAGCTVRRAGHAAMLSIAAMLMLYFLPMVIPPLERWNWMLISDQMLNRDNWQTPTGTLVESFAIYVAGMTMVAAGALGLSLLSISRGWRIESGRRMLYGAVSATFLILIATASFQLGANLPVISEMKLPVFNDQYDTQSVILSGQSGWIVDRDNQITHPPATQPYYAEVGRAEIPFELDGSDLRVGQAVRQGPYIRPEEYGMQPEVMAPGESSLIYSMHWITDGQVNEPNWRVEMTDLRSGATSEITKLAEYQTDVNGTIFNVSVVPIIWKDRLYVIGSTVALFDVSDARRPQMLSNEPLRGFGGAMAGDTSEFDTYHFTMALPAVPGLPAEQRLKAAALRRQWPNDGRNFCTNANTPRQFRLTAVNDDVAKFVLVGTYRPTLLEGIIAPNHFGGLSAMSNNGQMYTISMYNGVFNPMVSVYDLRGNTGPRLVGHFGAQGIQSVHPLDDGRAIVVASDKLYLIGPPRE